MFKAVILKFHCFKSYFHFRQRELSHRRMLSDLGVTLGRRMATPTHTRLSQSASRRASLDSEEVTTRCEVTKKICYLSLVSTKNLLSLTGKYKKSIIPHWLVQKIYYLSLVIKKFVTSHR